MPRPKKDPDAKPLGKRITIQPSDGDPGAPNFIRVEKLPDTVTAITFSVLNAIGDRVMGPMEVQARRKTASLPFVNPSEPGAYIGLVGGTDAAMVMVSKSFRVGLDADAEGGDDVDAPFPEPVQAAGEVEAMQGAEAGDGASAEDSGAADAGSATPSRRRR